VRSFLKNHPFAVEAFFERSVVLTFAVPKAELRALIPACLTLDTFQDEWAFVAVALVQTKDLRPKGFPRAFGNDFFLIGYRIFVRYTTNAGKRLRGLYILKSETDKWKMAVLGNLFTHYRYSQTDIAQHVQGPSIEITSKRSDLQLTAHVPTGEAPLPPHSPFASWREARRYAGPLPFTFTYNASTQTVLIIEGVREDWVPQPLVVEHYHVGFLATLGAPGLVLASAFAVHNIPYHWQKGRTEQWHP